MMFLFENSKRRGWGVAEGSPHTPHTAAEACTRLTRPTKGERQKQVSAQEEVAAAQDAQKRTDGEGKADDGQTHTHTHTHTHTGPTNLVRFRSSSSGGRTCLDRARTPPHPAVAARKLRACFVLQRRNDRANTTEFEEVEGVLSLQQRKPHLTRWDAPVQTQRNST
jgi:hypothetical protein